jgi:type II secretory pathway component GspD/PulD (secretin)
VTTSNQPNVSIRFENVSAPEALLAVLDNYSLVLVKDPKSKIARVTIKDPKAEDPLVARIFQLKYSDPTNLVGIVKTTLSSRSTVVADSRTSQLIINTTEKEVDNVLKLLATLDSATKQVLTSRSSTTRRPSPRWMATATTSRWPRPGPG